MQKNDEKKEMLKSPKKDKTTQETPTLKIVKKEELKIPGKDKA